MMKEHTPRTPASSRSIVRNHSPYCESTGPIVREGFVAARVRALQGFSHPAQIATRSHSPLTPCPPRRLHVYKLRSQSRSSSAPKSLFTGAETPRIGSVKHFRREILSKDYRSLVSDSGGSARSLSRSPSFPPQEQQPSLGLATPRSFFGKSRRAGNPSSKLFKDIVPSGPAQRNREHIKVPSAPSSTISEDDQIGSVPMKVSSLSGKAILSPRAMQVDLVEPQATWSPFPQVDDRHNSYFRQQVLKPRASIADKLVSMVEQGWAESDPFGKGYNNNNNNEFLTHALKSESYPRDPRPDRGDDSSRPKLGLRKVLSHTESYPVQTAPQQSELQHANGRYAPLRNEPKTFESRGSQKRTQLKARRSPAANTNQRSNSDFGIYYLKSESAIPTRERRAWTLPFLDRSTTKQGHIQRDVSPTLWPNHIRGHRSSAQDLESTRSPPSGEGSLSRPGSDLPMLGDDQLRQDSTAVSKIIGSRRSNSMTKGSTRSASRTTSFFKRFPWYKVALVDKQPVVQDSSKEGWNNYKASKSTQHDPTSGQIELLPGASKSHTLVERVYEENDDATKIGTPKNQGSIGQRAPNAMTSYYESSSQPSIQQTTSPQETNAWRVLKLTDRASERQQNSHANSESSAKDQPSSRSGTPTRLFSHSGSTVASFESPISAYNSQSFQPLWPEVNEDPRMQTYDSSYANPTKLQADGRYKHGSCDSGTVKVDSEFTTSPNPSNGLGSKKDKSTSKRSGAWTDSVPASGHKSNQDRPVRRELKGRGNGIKKIQVTVTFDGAEDLVVEAKLKKKDQRDNWRTIA